MVLTSKQQSELHDAILEYLQLKGYREAAASFSKESGATPKDGGKSGSDPLEGRKVGALERKWTAVLRLQKQVFDLERNIERMKEQAAAAGGLGGGGRKSLSAEKGSRSNRLPRAPAKHELSGHRAAVTAVAVHPVYTQIASASEDATIRLWDYETGDYERTLKGHTNIVQDLAYSPKGTLLASCGADMTVKLWDLALNACIKTLQGHEHTVSGVRFLSDDFLVSASRDKTLRVWSMDTSYCVQVLNAHADWVKRLATAASLVATASSDHSVRVWNAADANKFQLVADLRGHSHVVEAVVFAPPELVSVAGIGSAPEPSPVIDLDNADDSSSSAAASSSSSSSSSTTPVAQAAPPQFVASASRDRSIKIWHIPTGRCALTLTGHSNWVRDLVFHPSGSHLFSVSDDKSICIWDIQQARCFRTLENAHAHFISSIALIDEAELQLVSGGVDNVIRIWASN